MLAEAVEAGHKQASGEHNDVNEGADYSYVNPTVTTRLDLTQAHYC